MTQTSKPDAPKVPTERPDPAAAARPPEAGAEDRPGFDLGGASGTTSTVGSNTVPGGPKGSVSSGVTGSGRADGLTNLSGSRGTGVDRSGTGGA